VTSISTRRPRIAPVISVVVLTCICVPFLCYKAHAQSFEWYPSSTLSIGGGVNLSNPTVQMQTAVQYDNLVPIDSIATASVLPKFQVSQIHDVQELENFATFDSSLDANYLFFGGGGNIPWLTDYNFTGSSFVWGLRAFSDFGRFGLQKVTLTDAAKDSVPVVSQFESLYGNSYVNVIRKAAIISVIFSLDVIPSDTVQKLQQEVIAGLTFGVAGGTQVTGTLDAFLQQAMALGTLQVKIVTVGGPTLTTEAGELVTAQDLSNLEDVIAGFVGQISEANAAPVVYYTTPYSGLGVADAAPMPSVGQKQLPALALAYYDAAEKKTKLDAIVNTFDSDYAYVDRSYLTTYQLDRDQFAAYLADLTALAARVDDSTTQIAIPAAPAVQIAWPSPEIDFSYHLVSATDPATSKTYDYTIVDGSIHRAIVGEVLLVKSGAKLYDLLQSQEDSKYLAMHAPLTTYRFDNQFHAGSSTQEAPLSDAYAMRWVIGGQNNPSLDGATVVALDDNGKVITSCSLYHVADKVLPTMPANQLSE
jgi:hypothetical protein